ncbi:MAG: 5'/3'-nucleotidase SurE [Leptospiraceae bacterium]|nr:5'/3'-nucleotidase SurE [Leptospiraceae bacterium]MCP5512333.1 5'/3'-nucleotidase SurE [Leptospiraceae bacterium]
MNILITNDDGISSNGIRALEKVLGKKHSTFLIAPLKEKSATSMALSIFDKLRVEKVMENHYIVDGFPVDCVNIGLHGNIFPKIDLVLSGINRGVNLGHDVHYSGTVGAARHGAIHDYMSIALSSGNIDKDYSYIPEAEMFLEILETKLDIFQKGIVYNINFPVNFDSSPDKIKLTTLGKRVYYDTYEINSIYEGISDFFLGGSELGKVITPGSDFEAYEKGYVSITPISLYPSDYDEYKRLKSIISVF